LWTWRRVFAARVSAPRCVDRGARDLSALRECLLSKAGGSRTATSYGTPALKVRKKLLVRLKKTATARAAIAKVENGCCVRSRIFLFGDMILSPNRSPLADHALIRGVPPDGATQAGWKPAKVFYLHRSYRDSPDGL